MHYFNVILLCNVIWTKSKTMGHIYMIFSFIHYMFVVCATGGSGLRRDPRCACQDHPGWGDVCRGIQEHAGASQHRELLFLVRDIQVMALCCDCMNYGPLLLLYELWPFVIIV